MGPARSERAPVAANAQGRRAHEPGSYFSLWPDSGAGHAAGARLRGRASGASSPLPQALSARDDRADIQSVLWPSA